MKKKLVFATNNPHKLKEVSTILGKNIELLSLKDINCNVDIPETADTLEENAAIKSRYIYENYGFDCFSDDTGLEIKALDNAPGVYSARYAGKDKNAEANMHKVLDNLKDATDRTARFRTVISLILNGKEYSFEGIINGKITTEKHGNSGFGYDPVFQPDGYDKTFAELGDDIKNKVSHRAIAVNKLCEFLKSI